MSLYYTIFERLDGQQTYVANYTLAKEPLRNYRRSTNQSEPIEIQISYGTAPEQIQQLEEKMNDFYRTKPFVYRVPIYVTLKEVVETNKLTVVVPILYKKNWQDWAYKSTARNEMMKQLKKVIHELQIEFKLLDQKVKLLKEE
eukprot:NODE_525_length_7233_cov_0.321374.p5 type:complete len:143 gc:universal NODE_525_length_7233_cov_0.321374:5432-5004(-)